jgi:hypothetical protein
MTLGLAPRQADLFRSTAAFCEGRVAPGSIYGILFRECFALFPDEMFADLFDDAGRRSAPPMIVAVVMVLQRFEGCSDREAADRFCFDARWKYAAGGLDFGYPGFVHTVLVDMRARLARSAHPDRIFEVTLEAGKKAGLVGRRRGSARTPRGPPGADSSASPVPPCRHSCGIGIGRTMRMSALCGEAHLTEYQVHSNTARPHQGIAQRAPDDERVAPRSAVTDVGTQQIRRKPILNGLINEYTHAA